MRLLSKKVIHFNLVDGFQEKEFNFQYYLLELEIEVCITQ